MDIFASTLMFLQFKIETVTTKQFTKALHKFNDNDSITFANMTIAHEYTYSRASFWLTYSNTNTTLSASLCFFILTVN